MEFMSYLRPVLQEDIFPELHHGWAFLASHINSHNNLFQKVLNQRNKTQIVIDLEKNKNLRIQNVLAEMANKRAEKIRKMFELQAKQESMKRVLGSKSGDERK